MRRGWILLLLLAALALPVSAADVLEQERQILQVDSLTDPLFGQTRAALEEYELPEVTYFLETFMPSFSLTLDQLK